MPCQLSFLTLREAGLKSEAYRLSCISLAGADLCADVIRGKLVPVGDEEGYGAVAG